ncbi:ankyrin repeat domain-containing protein 50 [Podospora australis]|uniref:Ankyrin repeat domain-containing protein 50 n=1 Tax=Podospora australis TaxID=1536484 RepID=A0AAN6WIA0_9PEZI|nr:ankyrin repeat domain-containing protein 50 [Podospora australis]
MTTTTTIGGDDETVPTYTTVDNGGLESWVNSLPELTARLQLPLTHYPPGIFPAWDSRLRRTVHPPVQANLEGLSDEEKTQVHQTQCRIVASLFSAIASKNTEVVDLLISRGFISPDCPDMQGRTPLIAAVEAGNGQMVCNLVALGAHVNGYGRASGPPLPKSQRHNEHARLAERTPLMVAAAMGNLALVKLLMEDFGADDSIIAPDGQLALRLAADAYHREIVDYLPLRRGGAWRRWKTHHHVAVRRIKRAGWKLYRFIRFFVFDIPKFLLWTVPKYTVVKPLKRAGEYCWENKHKFGGWCKRQATAFPGRAKRAGKAVWRTTKKVPGEVWSVTKRIPKLVTGLSLWVWKIIKRIPGAMMNLVVWIWTALKKIGGAVGNVFLRIISVVHTVVAAVLDVFRGITLKDVADGLKQVVHAIFVVLPKGIWTAVKAIGKGFFLTFVGIFGCTAQLIIWLFQGLWWLVKYVPRQLGVIVSAIWGSMAKGYHEIMVLFNPKY